MSNLKVVIACFMAIYVAVNQASLVLGQDQQLQTAQEAMELIGQGKPLPAIVRLEKGPIEREMASQLLAAIYSFAGDEEKAYILQSDRQKGNLVVPPMDTQRVSALEYVLTRAKDRQIVIINESHDSPRHRQFISQLAKGLREIGFEYFACEALSEEGDSLRKRGYPVHSTGFYTCEPVFGQLLRHVLRLDYKPIAYESESDTSTDDPIQGINQREEQQCKNLLDRLLLKLPKARILIHVGGDHVMESARKAGNQEIHWLAARLKKETGIDPLTIDQTTNVKSEKEIGDRQDVPGVLITPRGEAFVGGHFRGAVDIQVYHPPLQIREGRPTWMFADKSLIPVSIPTEVKLEEGKLLVQAFHADESDDAVPADQIIVSSAGVRPPLMLREGRYRIATQDSTGKQSSYGPLDVSTGAVGAKQ